MAANYGGRWDLTQALQKLAKQVADGERSADSLTEEDIASELITADLPEPDLFIRTGGEQRISNFLIWQLAYTELYFTDTLWPEFNARALDQAIEWYGKRERRFGRTSEQLQEKDDA